MYAIIRAGGKQAKVHTGDVIDIERVKGDSEELTFEPLLVVDDDGTALSDIAKLAKASVVAKVLGESQGQKIDIFKYKNKSGYRRHQGHRQKYTRIEITGINLPGAKKPAAKKAAAKSDSTKAKSDSTKAKTDSTKAKTDSSKAKTDSTKAKTDSTKAKSASTNAKAATKKTSTAKPAKAAATEEE